MTSLERAKAIIYELIPAMTKGDLFMPPYIRNPLIGRIANEIDAAVAAVQRFTPVIESLLPVDEWVLVTNGTYVRRGIWTSNWEGDPLHWESGGEGFTINDVVGWKHLPPAAMSTTADKDCIPV